jgi:hypothetical protein
MRSRIYFAMALLLLGCGSSDSAEPRDAAATDGRPDAGKTDGLVDTGLDMPNEGIDVARDDGLAAPEVGKPDSAGGPEVAKVDGVSGLEVTKADGAGGSEVTKLDSAVDLSPVLLDGGSSEGDVPAQPIDAADALGLDGGEACSCGSASGGSVSKVSWSCFCSVESCFRTLGSFISQADGGKTIATGKGTVVVKEFAECNFVLVQAKTYSDYVPSSEYVFNRATGALLGARVWLDDREHRCPFPDASGWVFGYESGSYPVPTTCRLTDCTAGSGSCATDAL